MRRSTYLVIAAVAALAIGLLLAYAAAGNTRAVVKHFPPELVCSTGTTGFGALPVGTVVTVAPTQPGTTACWTEVGR